MKANPAFARISSLLLGPLVALLWLFQSAGPAHAIPAFARQTGQHCAACHMGWPELTPFGRAFKAGGFLLGGGAHPFPLAAMVQGPVFTHTAAGQPGGAAPGYGANDNFELGPVSLYYGGAVYRPVDLGAFLQVTYESVPNQIHWDMWDIRFAKTLSLANTGNFNVGLTFNNQPTFSDLWNSSPSYRYPYIGPDLAPTPAASTEIEMLMQEVGGAGAYVWWNRLIYAEFDGYKTLSAGAAKAVGVPPPMAPFTSIAPYWRLAISPLWDRGKQSFEIGTFGMSISQYPMGMEMYGADHVTDIGVDAQYQYIGGKNDFSAQVSNIFESDDWSASQPLGLTANSHDNLSEFNAKASYLYDQTYEGSVGFFNITGSRDTGLYAPDPIDGSANGSPNSRGFVFELDYMPWNYGSPWPYSTMNVKLGVQYTLYTKFNGGSSNYDGFGRNASDNNTLFFFVWWMF